MPFCKNCGSPVEGQFCPKCGTPMAAAPAGGGYAPPPPPPTYQQPGAAPPPQPVAAASGMADNVAGLLCYILGLITGILFLLLAPYNQNKTIRFHAFQSIFFNVGMIVLMIVLTILSMILTAIVPILGGILMMLVSLVVWLGSFVVWIMLMVKAYQNQKWVLPLIGPLAEKQA